MSKFVRQIVGTALLVLALCPTAVAQGGEELREFEALMARAEQEYGSVEFRSKWINYRRSGEVQQLDQLNGFMAGPYCIWEQSEAQDPPRLDAKAWCVFGSNRKYRFTLRRNASDYVLTELTAPPFTEYQTRQCSFAVPYTLETYHSLLGRADTHVVSRSEVSWRGQPHTEWVLDTTCGESGSKARIGLFVRPDRPGVVRGIRWYDPENLPQWVEETVVEYEADGGPWPAPKAIDEWHADKTKWLSDKSAAYETWRATRTEFSLWRRRAPGPPGEEFTLSHYNLPEPKQVPTKPGLGPGGRGRYAYELGPFGPSTSPPIEVPELKEPSLLEDLVEAAGMGVWLWLTVGSILVVAASIYIWYRIRAGTSEA